MKAVVLCAGRGARLGRLTAKIPKPLLPLGGQPLLSHTVRWLAAAGINKLFVNLHHRGEMIQQYFGDGSRWGVSITYLREPELLGSAGTVRALAAHLTETFLVIYGDNLNGCALPTLLSAHQQYGGIGTMALFHRDDVSTSGVVALGVGERIQGFVEKPSPQEVQSHWTHAGVLAWEPSILSRIPAQAPCDFGRDCFGAWLAQGLPMYGYRMGVHEPLVWIDTPEDYARAQQLPWVLNMTGPQPVQRVTA